MKGVRDLAWSIVGAALVAFVIILIGLAVGSLDIFEWLAGFVAAILSVLSIIAFLGEQGDGEA